MKNWTIALLLAVFLSGCGGGGLPPATETPKPDEAAMTKGKEESRSRGGYGGGSRRR